MIAPPERRLMIEAPPEPSAFSIPSFIYAVGESFYAAGVQFRPAATTLFAQATVVGDHVVQAVVNTVGKTTIEVLNFGTPYATMAWEKTKNIVADFSDYSLKTAAGAWKDYSSQFSAPNVAFVPNYLRNQTKNDLNNDLKKNSTKPNLPPTGKHFEDDGFSYNTNPSMTRIKIGDTQSDKLIHAYEIMRIDVPRFVLDQRQLPDFHFIRQRYKKLQKIYHPDRAGAAGLEESIQITAAYQQIKKLMTGPETQDAQFSLISSILRFYHKGKQDSLPYIILFCVGGAGTLAVMYYRKK